VEGGSARRDDRDGLGFLSKRHVEGMQEGSQRGELQFKMGEGVVVGSDENILSPKRPERARYAVVHGTPSG